MTPDRSTNNTLSFPSPLTLYSCNAAGPGGRLMVMQPACSGARNSPSITTESRQMLSMSILHELTELFKQIRGVMRPRRGFGMVLHRKDRLIETHQTFHRLIVEARVADSYPTEVSGNN